MRTNGYYDTVDPTCLCELTDEQGRDQRFELLDLIEHRGVSYVVLWPIDSYGQRAGALVSILRVDVDENGTESYSSVDDDSLLDELFRIFKDLNRARFHFSD